MMPIGGLMKNSGTPAAKTNAPFFRTARLGAFPHSGHALASASSDSPQRVGDRPESGAVSVRINRPREDAVQVFEIPEDECQDGEADDSDEVERQR